MRTGHVPVLLHVLVLFIFLLSTNNARPVADSRPVRRFLSIDDPDIPPAVRSVCPGGLNETTITNTTLIGTNGVRLTTGFCGPVPDDSDENPVSTSRPVVQHPTCPTALNNCVSRFGTQFQGNGWVSKCGAPCTSTCYRGRGGPNPNDCQHIVQEFWSASQQLFTLPPNGYLLYTYLSCGTGIQNQIASSPIGCSQTMIYDFADWGSIASYLAWACQAPQNARGGRCLGNTGLYQTNTNDFYVQVYPN